MSDSVNDPNTRVAWGPTYFLKEFAARNITFSDGSRVAMKVYCTPEGQLRISMGSLRNDARIEPGKVFSPPCFKAYLAPDDPAYTFGPEVSQEQRVQATRDHALYVEHEGFAVSSSRDGKINVDYSGKVDILLQTEAGLEVLVAAQIPSTMKNGQIVNGTGPIKITST